MGFFGDAGRLQIWGWPEVALVVLLRSECFIVFGCSLTTDDGDLAPRLCLPSSFVRIDSAVSRWLGFGLV